MGESYFICIGYICGATAVFGYILDLKCYV